MRSMENVSLFRPSRSRPRVVKGALGSVLGGILVATSLVACTPRTDVPGGDDPDDAQQCSPGITDTEVKIGSSVPTSGPLASWAAVAEGWVTYFDKVNAAGGVAMGDGVTRQLSFEYLDDGYDPARTTSNARTLIEQDQVAALANVLGTSPNLAIVDYVAEKGIPNLFAASGTDEFLDLDEPYWTLAYIPAYSFEVQAVGNYIIEEKPDAKVGILYQNDGLGKNVLANFQELFEGTGVEIVAEQSYELTSGSVDSQVVNLAQSGADVFVDWSTGTFMTQSLRKKHELGWEPLTVITSGGTDAKSFLTPAGEGAADGAVAITWIKQVSNPELADDEGMKNWMEFAEAGGFDPTNEQVAHGYTAAQLFVQVLEGAKGCTSEDLRDSAFNLKGATADLLLPGVEVNTTPDYPYTFSSVLLQRFEDGVWTPIKTVERE